MSSAISQMDIFERIINRKTYAIVVSTDVTNALEKYQTNVTNSFNDQLNSIQKAYSDEAGKSNPNQDTLQSLSIQFNQVQTQMQATLTMTNSTLQKSTSFASTLNSDLQSTMSSTSYLQMVGQQLNSLLKQPL